MGFPVAGPEGHHLPHLRPHPASLHRDRYRGGECCCRAATAEVAVMGCVVNGPGEAREADIGIAGGKGEAVLFIHGKPMIKKLDRRQHPGSVHG